MLVITSKELDNIHQKTLDKFSEIAVILCKKNTYGMNLNKEKKDLKKIFIYLMYLDNYKTFDLEDVNLDIIEIFKQINKIY